MREEEPQETSMYRQLGIFFVVMSAFLGSSGAGVGLGWLLWKKAGFPWWVILITSALGLYSASLQVIRYQKKLQK